MNKEKEILLKIQDLEVKFNDFVAVSGVNFNIYKGEVFSLVGESGSGKSTIGRAILRLNPTNKGTITYNNQLINGQLTKQGEQELRKKIQMIFQDPATSLNERATVDYIVSEGILNFKMYKDEAQRKQKVQEALTSIGLLPEHALRYPHEFSGGQRQRIGIARAIIMEPEMIVADEAISALDVSIRAQILNLLKKLQQERKLTYLFIAHDLSVVRYISDRIAVIHKGRVVELAPTEELFKTPLHPYTKSLLSAIPIPDPRLEKNKKLIIYTGKEHNYQVDKPKWVEVRPNHYVWANEEEKSRYQQELVAKAEKTMTKKLNWNTQQHLSKKVSTH